MNEFNSPDNVKKENGCGDALLMPLFCTDRLDISEEIISPFKGKKFHKCTICSRRYWNHEEHMLTHQFEKPFKCTLCLKAFKTKANLNGHQRLHRNKISKKYTCAKCNGNYATKNQLKKHISIHLAENNYRCEPCEKSFRSLRCLRNHQLTHNPIAQLKSPLTKCDICGRGCHDIVSHLKEHTGERNFECDHCHSTFKSKHNLTSHMAIHINARNYKCKLCARTFNFKTQLNRHTQSHSTNHPFVCDVCGTSFKYNNSLRVHIRSHTGERPYQCNQCEKSFSTSVSLRLHIRIHTGEKPYKCDICGRGFADGSTMKIHKRVHTGEHPYICHLCGKSTKQASNLKSHYNHFHKIHDITGKTIRKNAKIFAKYKTELVHADLLEILSRAASAAGSEIDPKPTTDDNISKLVEQDEAPNIWNQSSQSQIESDENYVDNSYSSASPTFYNSTEPKQSENTDTKAYIKPEVTVFPIVEVQLGNNSHANSTADSIDINHKKITFDHFQSKVEIHKDGKLEESNCVLSNKSKQKYLKTRNSHKNVRKLVTNVKYPKIEEIMIKEEANENDNEIEIKTETSHDDFSWFNMSENVINYSLETFPKKKDQITMNTIRKIHQTLRKKTELQKASNKMLENSLTIDDSDPNDKKPSSTTKGVKFLKCNICDRRYVNHDEHMRTHTHDKPFECDICHKTFKVKDYLKLHRKLHTEQKDVICDQCGAAFYNTHDLKRHMKRHSDDRPHKCPMCEKGFKETGALKNHLRTHSGERPFECQTCNKSFSSKMGIKLHLRTHTGERPYQCEFCESRFGDGSTYRQHLRIHTGERPYKCHICGKGTTQAGNLKSHLRHYHKIIVKNVKMTNTKYL